MHNSIPYHVQKTASNYHHLFQRYGRKSAVYLFNYKSVHSSRSVCDLQTSSFSQEIGPKKGLREESNIWRERRVLVKPLEAFILKMFICHMLPDAIENYWKIPKSQNLKISIFWDISKAKWDFWKISSNNVIESAVVSYQIQLNWKL